MNEPVELTVEECLERLNDEAVGRVAMATAMGPRIVPVNYAMHGGAIVFGTAPYSELGSNGGNADLAFEIDHIDNERQQGWSVVALGRAEVVDDPDELSIIRAGSDPTPWVNGQRHLYLRMRWREITGRRLAGAGLRAPALHSAS